MKEKLCLVQNLLEKRSARRKEGRFVVEGPHLIEEAQDHIDFVIYAENLPILSKLQAAGIECLKVSKKQFAEISEVETPQWILAVVREQGFDLKKVLQSKNPLIVFCIGVQDPGNLGTIIRTADAMGATCVILSRGTVDLYNPKVVRSTMGSIFHLPIIQNAEIDKTIELLGKNKIKIIALDLSGQKDYFALEYNQSAILVGNEGSGLPKEVIDRCDEIVKIPMPGKAESLNVGVSTAVVLYEALRQRRIKT